MSGRTILAETIDWLTRQLSNYSVKYTVTTTGMRPKEVESLIVCSFDEGRLTCREETPISGGLGGETVSVSTVLLKDLLPKCVVKEMTSEDTVYTPTVYDLILSSSRTDAITDETSISSIGSERSKKSEIHILFAQELAKRVAMAFEQLIKLSGGKPEPF